MSDEHLTPQERRAFADLPREKESGDLLEERTVRALRERGVLHPSRPRGLVLTRSWLAAAAVVVFALVLGGFGLGQYVGSQQTAGAMLAMHRQDGDQAVDSVRQAGAAYLAALSDLARLAAEQPDGSASEGRREALLSLHAVADQMVRLAPDDPVASRILQAFEQLEGPAAARDGETEKQQIIWF